MSVRITNSSPHAPQIWLDGLPHGKSHPFALMNFEPVFLTLFVGLAGNLSRLWRGRSAHIPRSPAPAHGLHGRLPRSAPGSFPLASRLSFFCAHETRSISCEPPRENFPVSIASWIPASAWPSHGLGLPSLLIPRSH